MNFRPHAKTEPEINLIPFIDVLLVVLIFVMLSSTYSKFTELQVRLPAADAEQAREYPKEVIVAVSSDGRYMVNKIVVNARGTDALSAALALATQAGKDSVIIISADASATHQAVITVMEAARRQGLTQITFATQGSAPAGAKPATEH
jgi:biopolymer transport protein ExbD